MSSKLDYRSIVEIAADAEAVDLLVACRNEAARNGPDPEGSYFDTPSMYKLSNLLRAGRTSRFQILHEELMRIILAISYSQAIDIEKLTEALIEALRDSLSVYENYMFSPRSLSVVAKDQKGQPLRARAGVYFQTQRACVEAYDRHSAHEILRRVQKSYKKKTPELDDRWFEITVEAHETTEAAFGALVQLFEKIMSPIFEMLETTRSHELGMGFNLSPGTTKEKRDQKTPAIGRQQDTEMFIRLCEIGIYGAEDSDTMKERLVRSLCLIVEAYHAKPIASAVLHFAAVEALVGDRRAGATRMDMIARNVAVLLQPNARERTAAINGLKRLYDARNAIVHGVDVQLSEKTHSEIRVLAYALFRAVVQWMYHHDDITKEFHSEDEYFGCLRYAHDESTAVPGIRPELASFLPRVDAD